VRARLEQDYSDKVEKMQEEMIQMVDDDEIENVGIMSGFMDELEELISEIDAEDLEKNKGGDEADTAKLMGRTPNSPEILMNNLRGDMRSVDARREELADLVGMREAQETPEGVLTLLQSVLAQQEAVPPMPMAPPMPPQGMPPEMMGGMPPEMMGGMPPQGMPPPPMGIEAVMPDMPGMYRGGPVQNFNRGSGQMGVTPASDAFAAYPSDVVEEAKRRVRHMVDGGMVQKYDRGGVVQHFQNGSTEEVVSSAGRYPAETVQGANAYIQQLLEQEPSAANIDLATAMNSEAELYKTLGLGTDPKDAQAQMLFDIGQAAFGYAGNVGADGRPMQGSAAARLSQSLGPLAGRVGARAGQMSKEAQALKMMALKGAQDKIATAQAADAALAARQGDLALDIAKQEPVARMLTSDEIATMKLDSTLPWQIDGKGKITIPGGREPQGPTFNLGDGGGLTPGQKKMDEAFAPINLEWLSGGGPDMGSQIASLATVARQLEEGEVNLTGLDVGMLPDVVNYFINPMAIAARDNVEAVVQRNLRLILGPQFTAKEGERLIARAYNPDLPEAENASRVRRLLLQMTTAAAQKQAMSDYFMKNGTLKDWTGTMPTIGDFEKAIDGAPGFTVNDIVGDSTRGRSLLEEED
jgi:hypothetical protein